ncbi:hypothetical protein [Polaromonas sp. CG9_12]|nr:hypothetical protein [Polaromonas sp. CG9_12]
MLRQGVICNKLLIHKGFSRGCRMSDRYNSDFPTSGRHFKGATDRWRGSQNFRVRCPLALAKRLDTASIDLSSLSGRS